MVEVGGNRYFGVNSKARPDMALRQQFLELIQQRLGALAGKPLNRVRALTHAEAHALMRAYQRRGSLPSEVTIWDSSGCRR